MSGYDLTKIPLASRIRQEESGNPLAQDDFGREIGHDRRDDTERTLRLREVANQDTPEQIEIAHLRERAHRLESAIRWALGEGPDNDGEGFCPPRGVPPRYWWREKLRRMAFGERGR